MKGEIGQRILELGFASFDPEAVNKNFKPFKFVMECHGIGIVDTFSKTQTLQTSFWRNHYIQYRAIQPFLDLFTCLHIFCTTLCQTCCVGVPKGVMVWYVSSRLYDLQSFKGKRYHFLPSKARSGTHETLYLNTLAFFCCQNAGCLH